MKILVLGGNRFFGKRLVSLLLEEGHQVTVLNRGTRDDGFGNRVTRIRCDRTDARDLDRAVGSQSWDIIYDQVCYDAQTAEDASHIFHGKVGRYIFTSSKSVYGHGSDLRETDFDPFHYSFAKLETYLTDYAEAKRQAEAAFFQRRAFPLLAIRFPVVFGPDDYTGRLEFHIERVAGQVPIYLPNPAAVSTYIHAADAAKTLLALKDLSVTGPLNVCSPDAIPIQQWMSWIEDEVGARAVIVGRPELGETSPLGITENWFMNSDRLKSLGLRLPELSSWLPGLIAERVRATVGK